MHWSLCSGQVVLNVATKVVTVAAALTVTNGQLAACTIASQLQLLQGELECVEQNDIVATKKYSHNNLLARVKE